MENNLKEAEKLVKKITRNVFRNSNLDFTVQFSISSLEPGKIKYSALISSPSRDIQEIPFRFNSYNELKAALEASLKNFKYEDIEKTEVQSRINVYKSKVEQLEEYLKEIEKNGLDENGFLNKAEEVVEQE